MRTANSTTSKKSNIKRAKYIFKHWAFVHKSGLFIEHIVFSNNKFDKGNYISPRPQTSGIGDYEELDACPNYLIGNGTTDEFTFYVRTHAKDSIDSRGYSSRAVMTSDIRTIIKKFGLDKMDKVALYEACLLGHTIALDIRGCI